MIADLARMGDLPVAIGQVNGIRSHILALGDPHRVAGSPGALRIQATAHRDVAGELQGVVAQGRDAVAGVAGGGLWQGAASESFTGFWTRFSGQVDGLASRHLLMAGSLDAIAGRAERLNQDVAAALAAVESWLRSAANALTAPEVAAVPGLVAQVPGLLSRWSTVLGDLEAFAGGLRPQIEIELLAPVPAFVPLSMEPWPQGRPGPIIDPVPPREPEILITTAPPAEPNVLITTPGPGGPHILVTTVPPREPGILITTLPGARSSILASESEGEPAPEGAPPSDGSGDPSPPQTGDPEGEPKIPPGSMPPNDAIKVLSGGDRDVEGELSKNFHRVKRGAGLGGADSTRVDPRTGEVYITDTGEAIGNVFDG